MRTSAEILAMKSCPACGLEAKSLLHRFCQKPACPIRAAINDTKAAQPAAKAAPGPWRVEAHYRNLDERDELEEWRVKNDDSGCWFATIHLGACAEAAEIAEMEATARLMVAAPDLLAALKAAVEKLALPINRDGSEDAIQSAIAAIAKAEGAQ